MSPLEMGAAAAPARPERSLGRLAAEFLRSLGRTVKVVSLYRTSHPIAADALGESYGTVQKMLAWCRGDRVSLRLGRDGWMADGASIPADPRAPEAWHGLLHARGIQTVVILDGVRLFEVGALAELLSLPSLPGTSTVADFMEQKGVRHIMLNPVAEAPAAAPQAAPASIPTAAVAAFGRPGEPSAAAVPTAPAETPSRPARPGAGSFSSLLRGLVETAVEDPDERAHVYQEALGLVRDALDRQVARATEALERDRRVMIEEKARASQVLSTAAGGKVIVDQEGRILMMNPAAEELSGKRLVDVAGRPLSEAVNPGEHMVVLAEDLKLNAEGPLSRGIRVIAQQEVERAIRRSLALVEDEAGRVVGTYAAPADAVRFKEAGRLQEEFLSRVTHELQAPLAVICSTLELLAEGSAAKLGAEEIGFLKTGLRNAERLGGMIREILDFSRLQSGRLSVRPVVAPLGPMVLEAVDGMRPWADRKGLDLAAGPVESNLSVLADHRRAVQVVTNLVANAIKNTPSGGSVLVSAAAGSGESEGFAVVSVKDTGCGIPAENLDRIFEKFLQLEGPQDQREGVGLGLAIVSELVRLHNGRVWAESKVGEGSVFRFTLPLAAQEPQAAP